MFGSMQPALSSRRYDVLKQERAFSKQKRRSVHGLRGLLVVFAPRHKLHPRPLLQCWTCACRGTQVVGGEGEVEGGT